MITIRNTIIASLVAFLLVGCASSTTPRLYVINSSVDTPMLGSESVTKVVVVGLVTIPDYLDQKKIVKRAGQYRLERMEFDRWAEPLDLSISAAIASTLRESVPDARVVSYPWTESGSNVQTLKIRLQRFEPTDTGQIVMEGAYVIGQVDAQPSHVSFREVEQTSGNTTADIIAAMSEVVRSLGLRIAQDIERQ